MSSHWKQPKPKWAIQMLKSCTLLSLDGKGNPALFKTQREAALDARLHLHPGNFRLVKVWVKYEEVQ